MVTLRKAHPSCAFCGHGEQREHSIHCSKHGITSNNQHICDDYDEFYIQPKGDPKKTDLKLVIQMLASLDGRELTDNELTLKHTLERVLGERKDED